MSRDLAFKDRFTNYLTNVITSDTSPFDVSERVLSDVKQTVLLSLTAQEYDEIFDALMTGADLSYQDKAHELVWLFWLGVKTMTLCDEVANCIGSSPEVQQAINGYLQNTSQNGGVGSVTNILNETIINNNLVPATMDCDNDHKFGMAMAIVESVHEGTLEIFQAIEVATNNLELAAIIASDVPLVSLAGKAVEMALWVQETAYELYILAYSETVRQEIACEIYCLLVSKDNCELSFQEIWDIWMITSVGEPPEGSDIIAWLDWLFAMALGVEIQAVKGCQLLSLLVMRFGGMFGQFSLGINSFKTVVELASNDIDEDWAILCTDCEDGWEQFWDFENFGMEAWVIDVNNKGVYTPGVGVVAELWVINGADYNYISQLRLLESVPRHTSMTVYQQRVRGTFASNVDAIWIWAEPYPVQSYNQGNFLTGPADNDLNFPEQISDNIGFQVTSCQNAEGNLGSAIVTGITLRGNGANPFAGRTTNNL